MASSIALRRMSGASSFLNAVCRRQVRSLSVVPSAARSYNTNAQMSRIEDEDDVEIDRRSDRRVSRRRSDVPDFFSDVFDPFSPTRSVSQLMNMMDQLIENPISTLSRGVSPVGFRRGWDAKEDESALHLRMDMPGLGKDNVRVSVEENTLIIKGEGEKENGEGESRRRYSTRIDLTPSMYKAEGIKAEMKNGVLKVIIPKVKEEDRKDVFQVNVE